MSPVTIEVIDGAALTTTDRHAVAALCSRAYDEDYAPTLATFGDATHVVARSDAAIVSHALWLTRWLQPAGMPPLRTAYVEAVATDEHWRRRGLATAVMRRLQATMHAVALAALSPSDDALFLYPKLGWETWRGPLAARTPDGLLPTPDELVMILRLPATPPLDLDAPLSIEWRAGEIW